MTMEAIDRMVEDLVTGENNHRIIVCLEQATVSPSKRYTYHEAYHSFSFFSLFVTDLILAIRLNGVTLQNRVCSLKRSILLSAEQ